MKTNIIGKNIEISDYLRQVCEKKVGKLNRFFDPETEAQVILSVEKNRHICEVTIPIAGATIRAKEVHGDMYASVDHVVEKLEKQIIKHRTKLERRMHEAAFRDIVPDTSETPDAEPTGRVVRTKRFALKPMDLEEAILQRELLGHSFFVFINADTGDTNVLYLRDDGNLGLIEPSTDDEDED